MMIFINFIIFMNVFLFFLMLFPSNLYKFHPLILVLLLMFYTIILTYTMNFMNMTYWYSYILFLVMVGGLMILFLYFTSLMNNQIFFFDKKYYLYLIFKFFLFIIYFLMYISYMGYWSLLIKNVIEIENLFMMEKNLMKLYYKNLMMDFTMSMNLYMIFYLFFTMICSVLICLKTLIPLRQLMKNLYDKFKK